LCYSPFGTIEAERRVMHMILHFDFSTGASGDKILGALLEVGEAYGVVDFSEMEQLAATLVPGVKVERLSLTQGGVQATGIRVIENEAPVRHWHEVREIIERANAEGALSERATALALDAFGAIAQAEATVHGCEIEKVHFHEVGAADSIIDICCSSFLFDCLNPRMVFATPLALGFGSFICSHGELPVPAPATARLIEGLPVYAGAHEGELTTPTGAALARVFVSTFGAFEPLPCMVPQAVGYGAGSRVIPGASNVIRVLAGIRSDLTGAINDYGSMGAVGSMGEAGGASGVGSVDDTSGLGGMSDTGDMDEDEVTLLEDEAFYLEGCALLETNIDHLSPEALAFACEDLLASGALDVWQESITMKKGRLAIRLCVLVPVSAAQDATSRIVELTGSLGVRSSYVERACVPRAIVEEQTRFGAVRYKTACVATPGGRVKLRRPEYEDVAQIARVQGLNFNTLYEELLEG
jgi:uncharacterized protein (TIGR00299 family) protein